MIVCLRSLEQIYDRYGPSTQQPILISGQYYGWPCGTSVRGLCDMERLFVYGTLAPGKSNHHRLKEIRGEWVAGTLLGNLLNEGWGAAQGCPGVVPSDDGAEVEGFVLTSADLSECWAMLDAFEGTGYQRSLVSITTEEGVVEAYVYALDTDMI